MKKVLLATHVRFWLENQGSSRRISSLLNYLLSHGVELHVYYSGFIKDADLKKIYAQYENINFIADNYDGISKRNIWHLKIASRFLKRLSVRFRQGYFFTKPQPQGFSKKFVFYRKKYFFQMTERIKPDVIIIEYISLAYLIEHIVVKNDDHPLLIIDTHDILHLRKKSFDSIGVKHWVDISKDEEIRYLDKFNVVMAIQSSEKKVLEIMLPSKIVIEVPYPLSVKEHDTKINGSLKIGYIGARCLVNKEAISFFIENVWSKLRGKYGELVSLDVFGSICDDLASYRHIDGVILHGSFKCTALVYPLLDIVINPVRAGGGLKIKNVEALCYSLPLVTTHCGAQGIEAGINEVFLCGDSADEQLSLVSRLIESSELRQALSNNAYAFSSKTFEESKCYKPLLDAIF